MPLSHRDYTVACICPTGVELASVEAMLDQTHPRLPTQHHYNNYSLGEIGGHNIVIAVLSEIDNNAAATVAI
jgi:nucleoside phosphorylase